MFGQQRLTLDKALFFALLAIGVGYAIVHAQGNLTPAGSPAPSMKTLDQIYSAITGDVSSREPAYFYGDTTTSSSLTLATVPAGKRLVILKMELSNTFAMDNSNKVKIGTKSLIEKGASSNLQVGDLVEFPDRCVQVLPGESLKLIKGGSMNWEGWFIGYYIPF